MSLEKETPDVFPLYRRNAAGMGWFFCTMTSSFGLCLIIVVFMARPTGAESISGFSVLFLALIGFFAAGVTSIVNNHSRLLLFSDLIVKIDGFGRETSYPLSDLTAFDKAYNATKGQSIYGMYFKLGAWYVHEDMDRYLELKQRMLVEVDRNKKQRKTQLHSFLD